ncbi:MAG: Tex family protein [Ghiorsea sp.]|nr:Tex family protein [Ghiorsea sp.]
MQIIEIIAQELGVQPKQVKAAVSLLDEGATVPFISRYRKEMTGNLDDIQLRALEKRLGQLRDFTARQQSILKSIKKQNLLTPQLQDKILAAVSLTQLEDLYLPYKPKRRSKASVAKEAGLQPLAGLLLSTQEQNPEQHAQAFVNHELGIDSVQDALQGAQDILVEQFSEDALLLGKLRKYLQKNAVVCSRVVKKKQEEAVKFTDYFSYTELYKNIPSHRALALFRGQQEGFLRLKLLENIEEDSSALVDMLSVYFQLHPKHAAYTFLQRTADLAWQKIRKRFQTDFFQDLRQRAEEEAVKVFGENIRDLLLAAPAGHKAVLGLDPGIRTGVKVAVIDQQGKLLETAVIYPHQPKNRWQESLAALAVLVDKHKPELVAIGNGTGSRETEKLVAELIETYPQFKLTSVIVSEAGASIYSASELASKEFPNIDVSLRGAVSIARRLQDPLAELVKIEPKAIGVGQYQHDINQSSLDGALTGVVEDCVNAVGVDVNTASVELLAYVSGLNKKVAAEIVKERDVKGAFSNRNALKSIKGLGAKTFEQAAGFLRILNGDNPLDASAVHPEAYALVEAILSQLSLDLKKAVGQENLSQDVNVAALAQGDFGEQTVRDVLAELEKPGRDPRPSFKTATFKSGVNDIRDLRVGMQLEGVVSNVTNFGAFVDVGVHQDGLVHISALADQFVDDPRKVVKTGQVVTVKVSEVDIKRRRISLSMRSDGKATGETVKNDKKVRQTQEPSVSKQVQRKLKQKNQKKDAKGRGKTQADNAFAAAFAKALQK